ncbi:unnamed protein product, partial [Meganyctiphanes norvegica]
ALNSGHSINTVAFRKLGLETAKIHVDVYLWFPMPQSIHRLFIHGADIAELCPVTMGESSEEAIESSHKCSIWALNHHSRSNSYKNMTTDMGHNRLIKTEPFLNDIITPYRGKEFKADKQLPHGALGLIKASMPIDTLTPNGPDNIEYPRDIIVKLFNAFESKDFQIK